MISLDPASLAGLFIAAGMLACAAIIAYAVRYGTYWRAYYHYDEVEQAPWPRPLNGRRGQ